MSEVVATDQQELTGKCRPYPAYKDSGVEWLGNIPAGWHVKKLKYLAPLVTKKASNRIHPIGLENIESWTGRFLPSDSEFQGEGIEFVNGDILFGKLRPYLAKVMLADSVGEAVGDFHVIRPVDDVVGRYLQYQILTKEFISVVDGSTFGAKMPRVSWEFMADLACVQPSKDEAISIVTFLDYETARVDRLIAQQQRLIELLKEKRQAVISHAVTKGLNPNAPMKYSGIEWLGQVPEHWIVAGFKKYIEPIVDYRGKTPTKTESGVFLVTARNIKNGSIDYSLSEEFISEDDYEEVMRRGKPKLGDVLFTTEAPLGEVAQVDNESIALAQRIIKFRGLRDILDCSYLKLFIQSTEFQHGLMTFATGSTALGIKSDRLGYLKQLVPPISEQNQIVEFVAKHAMQFDKLIDIANKAIQLMLERRTALISAAVTGRIDLRGWTPPAEEAAA